MSDWIYALDIGTRKVAGLVGRRTARGAEVIALEVQEHSERSMLDGQVHDVPAVAAVVRRVTRELELRLGEPLKEVAIAVAGRALHTAPGASAIQIPEGRPVTEEDLRFLERLALEKALPSAGQGFHCVGFTTVACRLDGVPMRSLLDQRGRTAELDVLATFLPRVVLDGLLAVCEQAGLKADAVTLEPIAALEAVIPPDLRLLNLALVDVGAGTSDIAVVKGGHVVAFAMVPMAGDEVTEALCQQWVMDFHEAERLKRALSGAKEGSYRGTDIFGKTVEMSLPDALRSVQEVVKNLSRTVADRILELNGGAPAAVVLVGGGSATAGLTEQLGVDLNLENRRIGVRRPTQALDLEDRTGALTEAWGVTPAGILLIAARGKGLSLKRVFLNGTAHSTLQLGEKTTLFDLVTRAGLPPPERETRQGKDLHFTLDGRLRVIEGAPGQRASFRSGERELALTDVLEDGMSIAFTPSRAGADARFRVDDLLRERKETACFLNGLPIVVRPRVFVNGRLMEGDSEIPEGAEVSVRLSDRLGEVLESQGFELGGEVSRQILVSINGEPRIMTQKSYRLTANGQEAGFETQVRPGDILEFTRNIQSQYRVRDVVILPKNGADLRLVLNGRPFLLKGEPGRVFMNGSPVSPDEFLIDHATLVTRDGTPAVGLVSHILAQMEKPRASGPGQRLILTVDGREAGFTTEVREGSEVIIAFEGAPFEVD